MIRSLRLPALAFAALLALCSSAQEAQQDAAIDPECLDTDSPCEADNECCSNQCLDSFCTGAALDPRLLDIIAACPEASNLINSWDTQLPDQLLSGLLFSDYLTLRGERRGAEGDLDLFGGDGGADLTRDGTVLLQWIRGWGESEYLFLNLTGVEGDAGAASTLWNVRVLGTNLEPEAAPTGGCWVATQDAGDPMMFRGDLATIRLSSDEWEPVHVELFAAADDERRLVYSLDIAPEMPAGDIAVDPDCLDFGAACEADEECCAESCIDSICQPPPPPTTEAGVARDGPRESQPADAPTGDVAVDPECLGPGFACESDDECCSRSCEDVCAPER